jgi:hypothetical protein
VNSLSNPSTKCQIALALDCLQRICKLTHPSKMGGALERRIVKLTMLQHLLALCNGNFIDFPPQVFMHVPQRHACMSVRDDDDD